MSFHSLWIQQAEALLHQDAHWARDGSHQHAMPINKELFVVIKRTSAVAPGEAPPPAWEEHAEALRKILYRTKNQHRVTKFWQHLHTLYHRLPPRAPLEQLLQVLQKFRQSFFIAGSPKRLHCPSHALTTDVLQCLHTIQSTLEAFCLHCLRTADYLNAEITKGFFLPLCLVSFGMTSFFHSYACQLQDAISSHLQLYDDAPTLAALPGSPSSSIPSSVHEHAPAIQENENEEEDEEEEEATPLSLNFLSLPSKKSAPTPSREKGSKKKKEESPMRPRTEKKKSLETGTVLDKKKPKKPMPPPQEENKQQMKMNAIFQSLMPTPSPSASLKTISKQQARGKARALLKEKQKKGKHK